MLKRDFITLVAAKTGLTKKDSERTMDALFQTLGEVLTRGERVIVSGFGIFETKDRAARTGRNPLTGETMPIPPYVAAAFRPSKELKEQLNPR